MVLEDKVDMLRYELAIVIVLLLVLMYRAMTGCSCSSTHSDTSAPSDTTPAGTTASGIIEGMLKSPKARTGLGNAGRRTRNPGGSVKRGGSMYKQGPRKSGFAAYTINGSSPFSDGINTTGGTFTNTSMLF